MLTIDLYTPQYQQDSSKLSKNCQQKQLTSYNDLVKSIETKKNLVLQFAFCQKKH